MSRNKAGRCCINYEFSRIADLAQADGVEFTLGKCIYCGTYIVDCYAPYGPNPENHNVPVVITEETANIMRSQPDYMSLRNFMNEWFNDIT